MDAKPRPPKHRRPRTDNKRGPVKDAYGANQYGAYKRRPPKEQRSEEAARKDWKRPKLLDKQKCCVPRWLFVCW